MTTSFEELQRLAKALRQRVADLDVERGEMAIVEALLEVRAEAHREAVDLMEIKLLKQVN